MLQLRPHFNSPFPHLFQWVSYYVTICIYIEYIICIKYILTIL